MNTEGIAAVAVALFGLPAAYQAVRELSKESRLRHRLDAYINLYDKAPEGESKQRLGAMLDKITKELHTLVVPNPEQAAGREYRRILSAGGLIYLTIAVVLWVLPRWTIDDSELSVSVQVLAWNFSFLGGLMLLMAVIPPAAVLAVLGFVARVFSSVRQRLRRRTRRSARLRTNADSPGEG